MHLVLIINNVAHKLHGGTAGLFAISSLNCVCTASGECLLCSRLCASEGWSDQTAHCGVNKLDELIIYLRNALYISLLAVEVCFPSFSQSKCLWIVGL